MNKKELIEINMKHLFEVIDYSDKLDKCQYDNLTNILKKVKFVNYLAESIVIKIVVKNINQAVQELLSSNIVDIINVEDLYLLRLIYQNNICIYEEASVHILFIDNRQYNTNEMLFLGLVTKLSLFIDNGQFNIDYIEQLNKKDKSSFVKGARKSLLNTLFKFTTQKPYRVFIDKDDKSIIHINQFRDKKWNIKNKYINLKCPICYKSYEITSDNISKIIIIPNKLHKITFNCQHENSVNCIKEGAYSINLENYKNDLNKNNTKSDLIIWFINNFKRITNAN